MLQGYVMLEDCGACFASLTNKVGDAPPTQQLLRFSSLLDGLKCQIGKKHCRWRTPIPFGIHQPGLLTLLVQADLTRAGLGVWQAGPTLPLQCSMFRSGAPLDDPLKGPLLWDLASIMAQPRFTENTEPIQYLLQGDPTELPLPIPLTAQAMDPAGAYILDTGRVCVLWLGRALEPNFLVQVTPSLLFPCSVLQ